MRSNAFGLTPAGRQQLRWLIVDQIEAPDQEVENNKLGKQRVWLAEE
jgi:hypothetical protein